ncbi:MAG: MFS transporter [Deltaproteobacteria bacterium]|nr:MFS transporter [Deltaproteobacteria bacterium]
MLIGGATILGTFGLSFAIPSLWLAFIANAIRGIGWGAFNTAQSTGIALTAPVSRRAEAAGYAAIATITASAFAPAFGLWLLTYSGKFSVVFALAGAAGFGATVAAVMIPAIGSGKTTFREALRIPRGAGWSLDAFIERPVLVASFLLVCMTLTQPVTFAFVPLHAKAAGVPNISLYFLTTGATGILARIVLGRFVDRGNRGVWIAAGFGTMIIAFAFFILADRIELFMAAGFLNALGHSLVHPALTAYAMDRAAPGRMGKAMATFSMSYRVGEGLGAPLAGALIVAFGYPAMYGGAMIAVVAGLALTALSWRTVGKPLPRHTPA